MLRYEIILRLISNANPIRKVRGVYFSRVSPIALLSSSKLSRSSSLRSHQIHGDRIQPYSAPRRFERKPAQAVLQRHLRVSFVVDDLHPAQPRPEEQKNSQSD